MNITPIQNNNYKQNTPTFKMNIKFADEATKNVVNADFTDFWGKCSPKAKLSYFGTEKFDFNTYWKNFQDAFRNMTKVQNDEGLNNSTVNICLDKIEKSSIRDFKKNSYSDLTWIKYEYIDENGVLHKIKNHELATNSLLKNNLFDNNRPFSSATRGVLATIADAIAHSGVGYGKENKLSNILRNLRKDAFSVDPNDITSLCEVKINREPSPQNFIVGG